MLVNFSCFASARYTIFISLTSSVYFALLCIASQEKVYNIIIPKELA